ncbi:MAG TPA: biotin/lipoyl-containing protein, partial [Thermoanaerobaculia bacterium]|nr:biotin/lipoyl-containing protein [Thermoanaerobaculia bacterium]
ARPVVKFFARHAGQEIPVEVDRSGTSYRVRVGEETLEVDIVAIDAHVYSLRLEDGRQFAIIHHADGDEHEVAIGTSNVKVEIVDPLTVKRRRREDEGGSAGMVTALMPGRIVRVLVNKGDAVRKGAGLVILEAMKMENEIQSPGDGTVDEVLVTPGQTVDSGAPLVHITPV